MSGMVNICELLENVVKWNEPKVLTGSVRKNGTGAGKPADPSGFRGTQAPRRRGRT